MLSTEIIYDSLRSEVEELTQLFDHAKPYIDQLQDSTNKSPVKAYVQLSAICLEIRIFLSRSPWAALVQLLETDPEDLACKFHNLQSHCLTMQNKLREHAYKIAGKECWTLNYDLVNKQMEYHSSYRRLVARRIAFLETGDATWSEYSAAPENYAQWKQEKEQLLSALTEKHHWLLDHRELPTLEWAVLINAVGYSIMFTSGFRVLTEESIVQWKLAAACLPRSTLSGYIASESSTDLTGTSCILCSQSFHETNLPVIANCGNHFHSSCLDNFRGTGWRQMDSPCPFCNKVVAAFCVKVMLKIEAFADQLDTEQEKMRRAMLEMDRYLVAGMEELNDKRFGDLLRDIQIPAGKLQEYVYQLCQDTEEEKPEILGDVGCLLRDLARSWDIPYPW